MRVLICGSRHFNDYAKLFNELFDLNCYKWKTIIHGGARGADSLANLWAEAHNYEIECYPADWKTHGKAAGPIRNRQMLVEGKPDLVVAFLAPDSRGTKNMIEQAEKAGIPVKVINI